MSKNSNFGGPTPLSLHRWGWNLAWRRGPFLRAKFHPHRCNVSPLRGEKPQNRPFSKLNTGRFALRAMLPVIAHSKLSIPILPYCGIKMWIDDRLLLVSILTIYGDVLLTNITYSLSAILVMWCRRYTLTRPGQGFTAAAHRKGGKWKCIIDSWAPR